MSGWTMGRFWVWIRSAAVASDGGRVAHEGDQGSAIRAAAGVGGATEALRDTMDE